MIYNEIGKTGLRVSNLSFGASSLGGVFHQIRETEAIDAVFTAVEKGMNFIDVSPYLASSKRWNVFLPFFTTIPSANASAVKA